MLFLKKKLHNFIAILINYFEENKYMMATWSFQFFQYILKFFGPIMERLIEELYPIEKQREIFEFLLKQQKAVETHPLVDFIYLAYLEFNAKEELKKHGFANACRIVREWPEKKLVEMMTELESQNVVY